MKFKTIFIIFNAVIVFSFLFIFFMPLILLGNEYFTLFAAKNWIAALLFAVTLGAINSYFLSNWKLFSLLEKEDWNKLITFLEERIYQRSKLRSNYLKMLINAYLLTSNTQKILDLEAHLREKKSVLVKKFALQLGIPHLLKNEPAEAEKYFGRLLAEPGLQDRDWIRWNLAFSLMQQKLYPAAREELLGLIDSDPEPLLKLLTLYMLDSYTKSDKQVKGLVEQEREKLKHRYSQERWKRKIAGSGRNMEAVILSQIIRDASEWLYGPASEFAGNKPETTMH